MEQRTTKWYQDMDKVAKIRAEIERLKKCSESAKMEWIHTGCDPNAFAEDCRIASFNKLLFFIDSLQEEPVRGDFEMALTEMIDKAQKCVVEPWVVAAQWKDELVKLTKDEEPVSDDLGEYINKLSKQFPEVSFAKLSRIAVRVAKWQKEQMMKDATEAIVKVDAGGYPYIPQIELYDYDKDVPLAKEGEKYKVILIKEEYVWG